MSDTHDVISAFLDDEPFDAQTLAQVLAEPAARELLIDLVALRHLVQPGGNDLSAFDRKSARSRLHALAAVAAVFVALASGYFIGERRTTSASSEVPAATRVVEAPPAWQEIPAGRMR
jgi:hypothetical protein